MHISETNLSLEIQDILFSSPSVHSASLHSVNCPNWQVPWIHEESPQRGSTQSLSVSHDVCSVRHTGASGQLLASCPENKIIPSQDIASGIVHIAQSVEHVSISFSSHILFPQIGPVASRVSNFALQIR